jgi:hypothetical protein
LLLLLRWVLLLCLLLVRSQPPVLQSLRHPAGLASNGIDSIAYGWCHGPSAAGYVMQMHVLQPCLGMLKHHVC